MANQDSPKWLLPRAASLIGQSKENAYMTRITYEENTGFTVIPLHRALLFSVCCDFGTCTSDPPPVLVKVDNFSGF